MTDSSSASSRTPLFGQPSLSPASQPFNLSRALYPAPPLYVGGVNGIPAFGQQKVMAPAASPLCPVCHATMSRGQATVTSECNHTLHLRCIASHYCARSVCPVCSARWRDCVSLLALPPPPSAVFDDDEPPPPSLLDQVHGAPPTNKNGVVVLKTHCEDPAVARDTARDKFAVLVQVKAPATAELVRPSLDIVTVLDVSSSMAAGGNKLALLKQAMSFVIDRLGPRDRLSIVAFSCEARLILRLARMSDAGKATAKAAIESLVTKAGTDIEGGLRVAADVLDGRRHKNGAVAGVILMSDGKDNHAYHHPNCISSINRYSGLVPRSLSRTFGNLYPPPVHLFGLGTDHDDDAEAMHAIARQTRGTFSVIDKETTAAMVQDSLARCIGGLLSVAVQEARVVVECLHPGVHVRAVKFASGRYYPINMGGRAASVDVGEMCADEERRFLLFLDVPVDDGSVTTRLVKVSCTYKDAATGRSVDVSCEDDAAVQRPVVVPATEMDMEPSCVEVARERFRVEAGEDIAAARAAADRGENVRAAQILDRRQEASSVAAMWLAGDEKCAELVAELRVLSARVADRRREYEQTGRASRVPAFGTTPAAGSTFGATATAMGV